MSKEDYVYSYIERKIINTKESHKFNEKRYDIKKSKNDTGSIVGSILLGTFLGILALAILIIKDILLY